MRRHVAFHFIDLLLPTWLVAAVLSVVLTIGISKYDVAAAAISAHQASKKVWASICRRFAIGVRKFNFSTPLRALDLGSIGIIPIMNSISIQTGTFAPSSREWKRTRWYLPT